MILFISSMKLCKQYFLKYCLIMVMSPRRLETPISRNTINSHTDISIDCRLMLWKSYAFDYYTKCIVIKEHDVASHYIRSTNIFHSHSCHTDHILPFRNLMNSSFVFSLVRRLLKIFFNVTMFLRYSFNISIVLIYYFGSRYIRMRRMFRW